MHIMMMISRPRLLLLVVENAKVAAELWVVAGEWADADGAADTTLPVPGAALGKVQHRKFHMVTAAAILRRHVGVPALDGKEAAGDATTIPATDGNDAVLYATVVSDQDEPGATAEVAPNHLESETQLDWSSEWATQIHFVEEVEGPHELAKAMEELNQDERAFVVFTSSSDEFKEAVAICEGERKPMATVLMPKGAEENDTRQWAQATAPFAIAAWGTRRTLPFAIGDNKTIKGLMRIASRDAVLSLLRASGAKHPCKLQRWFVESLAPPPPDLQEQGDRWDSYATRVRRMAKVPIHVSYDDIILQERGFEDVEMIITKEARRRTSPKSVKLHQERTWMKLLIPSAKRVISATPELAPAPLAPWFPAKGTRVANEGRGDCLLLSVAQSLTVLEKKPRHAKQLRAVMSSHMERRKAGSEISRSEEYDDHAVTLYLDERIEHYEFLTKDVQSDGASRASASVTGLLVPRATASADRRFREPTMKDSLALEDVMLLSSHSHQPCANGDVQSASKAHKIQPFVHPHDAAPKIMELWACETCAKTWNFRRRSCITDVPVSSGVDTVLLAGTGCCINDWKARVRDLSLASKWVKSGPGFLAITPSEQGDAIKAEWLRRWPERSPAAVAAGVSAADVFAEGLASRTFEFPGPPPWTVVDIRAQIRSSAAGLDGLSFQHYRDVPDVHLERLAALYSELDAGMQFPQAWHAARLVCIPKESRHARPLTVMQVAYCLWAARSASLLGHWASAWLSPELIGGRGGAPPAVHSANAYHEQTQLWRETPKNALIRSVLGVFDVST
ncbi:rbcL, partial [Symbiodinium sp. KB8]